MTPEQQAALRAPFPRETIGYVPRAGTHLEYVGHAAVTDRLLAVDPEWNWEPVAWAADGTPYWREAGRDAVMWIRLTVCGVTRLGVGTCPASTFDVDKQLIGDAIRNAAMRFGVALDLWAKEDLRHGDDRGEGPDRQVHRRDALKTKAAALLDDGAPLAEWRASRDLPPIDASNGAQLRKWEVMLAELEASLAAPFETPACEATS